MKTLRSALFDFTWLTCKSIATLPWVQINCCGLWRLHTPPGRGSGDNIWIVRWEQPAVAGVVLTFWDCRHTAVSVSLSLGCTAFIVQPSGDFCCQKAERVDPLSRVEMSEQNENSTSSSSRMERDHCVQPLLCPPLPSNQNIGLQS